MRINLTTPFADKDQVKALGARWDSQKKTWYITHVEDLTPFARWLPEQATSGKPATRARDTGGRAGPVDTSTLPPHRSAPPHLSTPAPAHGGPPHCDPPHCGCHVLPWEPCVHTAAVM